MASPIAREIEATGRRTVLLGAVYTALDRLQEMGLVTSTVGDPTPERGGKAKRFFRVTAKGLKAIKDTQRALIAMWTNVPALKGRNRMTARQPPRLGRLILERLGPRNDALAGDLSEEIACGPRFDVVVLAPSAGRNRISRRRGCARALVHGRPKHSPRTRHSVDLRVAYTAYRGHDRAVGSMDPHVSLRRRLHTL